jgi:AcrR family transcriptional regulator
MTTTAGSSRPTRKDVARNRELLLRAAREVFAQQGLNAGLDDIARHAGLGVATAYRHFADKQQLAAALMEQATERFIADATAALEDDDPWRGLVRYLESSTALLTEDRGLRQVLAGAYDPQRFHDQIEQVLVLLEDIVERARWAGMIRADAQATDVFLLGTMLCSVADLTIDAKPDLWRRYLTMFLEGLKPGGDPLAVTAIPTPELRSVLASSSHPASSRSRHD